MRILLRASVLGAMLTGATACDNDPTTAAPPTQLNIVSGDAQEGTVNQELAQPLVVKVEDENGRPVRGQLVNFRVAHGGGSVFAGSAVTSRAGIAQERWTLGTVADTQRVEARAVDPETGAAIVFATFRAVGRPAEATSVAHIQAVLAGPAGAPLADSAAAVVRDAHGNPVPGVTVAWTVMGGGGSVSPATSMTNAQGIARAQWTLGGNVSTPQTLRASAGVSTSTTLTATALVTTGGVWRVGSTTLQTTQLYGRFPNPYVVEVRQNGVPLEGALVRWTTERGTLSEQPDVPTEQGGGVTSVTTPTDADGRARVYLRAASMAGMYRMQANFGNFTLYFGGEVTPGRPTQVRTSWIDPVVPAGIISEQTWQVTDDYGNGIAGARIRFTATYGTVAPDAATTDGNGYVSTRWTFPVAAGGPEAATATLRGSVDELGLSGSLRTAVWATSMKLHLYDVVVNRAVGEQWFANAYLEDERGWQFSLDRYTGCTVVWSAPAAVEITPIQNQYPRVSLRGTAPGTYTVTATCEPMGLVDTLTMRVQ